MLEAVLDVPQRQDALTPEQQLEIALRESLCQGKAFIYNGDTVVSEDVDGRNPNPGHQGVVLDIQPCLQYPGDPDRLVYRIRDAKGKEFHSWGYTLRRMEQLPSNAVIERLFRSTNAPYEMERDLQQ